MAAPFTVVEAGGIAVTLVDDGVPVALYNPDGSDWTSEPSFRFLAPGETLRGINIRVPFGYGIVSGGNPNAFDVAPYRLGWDTWALAVPSGQLSAMADVFNAVRLVIDPGPMMAAPNNGVLDGYIASFFEAADDIIAEGMKVVFNLHAKVEETTEPPGYGFEDVTDGLAGPKWTRYVEISNYLAAAVSDQFAPEDAALEPFNEPSGNLSAADWRPYMKALFDGARASAPQHTIIVNGTNYQIFSTIPDLVPADYDAATMFSFHTYDPFMYTYQGLSPVVASIHRLKFPPYEPDRASAIAAVGGDTVAVGHLEDYFDSPWDAAFFAATVMTPVVGWADSNGIARNRVMCGEFGAGEDFNAVVASDHPSKAHHLRMPRLEFEAAGISWVTYHYVNPGDGFGIADSSTQVLDPDYLAALSSDVIGAEAIAGVAVPSTLPNGWGVDATAAWSILAVTTEDGIACFDLQVTNTGGQYINLLVPDWTAAPMAQNDVFELGGYYRLLSGSLEFMRHTVYTFGGATQQTDSEQFEGSLVGVAHLRHGYRRHLHTVENASAVNGNGMITITPTGTAVVRIGAPSFRKIA